MMKVKEYLVSEILDLKHNIRKLQDDIARDSAMIDAQRARIESFERREEKFKTNNNKLYGDLCEVKRIISKNLVYEVPGDHVVGVRINADRTDEKEDFDKLLKILGLDNKVTDEVPDQEVPDEIPED